MPHQDPDIRQNPPYALVKAFFSSGIQKSHSADENFINGRQKSYSDGAILLSGIVISPSRRAFRDSGKAFFYSGRQIFCSRMAFLPSRRAFRHSGRLICSFQQKKKAARGRLPAFGEKE